MDNTELYLSSLDMSLSLCLTIKHMAAVAKTNKRNCQLLAERVKVLEGLILTLKKKEHEGLSEPVQMALKKLCSDLKSAKMLMERVSQNNSLSSLKFKNDDYQFSDVNEKLIDNFQALSGFFLIEQGKNTNTMGPTASTHQPNAMRPMDPTAQMPQPNAMRPMDPTAQMPQPNAMPSMMYNPTASMPQPSVMPSMMYNPTAQMPQPNAMYPMDPTASMPQPSVMPSMMYNPTASMPQPSVMPSMMYNPTAQMPQPSAMPSMSMYTSAPPYPSQSTMPTFTMRNPTTPAPFSGFVPSMAMSDSISPLSSIPFSNQTDHPSNMCMMAPSNVSRQTNPVVPNYGFLP